MYSYRRTSTNPETAPSCAGPQRLAADHAWASAWTREPRCEVGGEAAEAHPLACARQDHDCSDGGLVAGGVVVAGFHGGCGVADLATQATRTATCRAAADAPRTQHRAGWGDAVATRLHEPHATAPVDWGCDPAAETVQDAPPWDRLSAALLEGANSGCNPLKTATGAVNHLNTEQE